MSLETKAGMVVSVSFLCLVSTVVFIKVRPGGDKAAAADDTAAAVDDTQIEALARNYNPADAPRPVEPTQTPVGPEAAAATNGGAGTPPGSLPVTMGTGAPEIRPVSLDASTGGNGSATPAPPAGNGVGAVPTPSSNWVIPNSSPPSNAVASAGTNTPAGSPEQRLNDLIRNRSGNNTDLKESQLTPTGDASKSPTPGAPPNTGATPATPQVNPGDLMASITGKDAAPPASPPAGLARSETPASPTPGNTGAAAPAAATPPAAPATPLLGDNAGTSATSPVFSSGTAAIPTPPPSPSASSVSTTPAAGGFPIPGPSAPAAPVPNSPAPGGFALPVSPTPAANPNSLSGSSQPAVNSPTSNAPPSVGQFQTSGTPPLGSPVPNSSAPSAVNPPSAPAPASNQIAQAPAPSFGPGASPPPIGTPATVAAPPISVPAPPAVATDPSQPLVEAYDETTYRCQPGDSFDSISKRFYNSERYARALVLFNRNHFRPADGVTQEPPVAQAGQPIYLPPVSILERHYASALPGGVEPAQPANAPAPVSQASASQKAAGAEASANAGSAQKLYRVRAANGELVADIAKRALGTVDRWVEIQQLNPQYNNAWQYPLVAGSVLVMPANAQIDPANAP